MRNVQCANCKKIINLKEDIKVGTIAECGCGCIQGCLDIDPYISRWRVINPNSFEDKRDE